jgi:Heparinase II/III-like protein
MISETYAVRAGDFLTISRDELDRARERVAQPQWQAAAGALRDKAEALLAADRQMPACDCGWYDADPGRPFAETYTQWHTYNDPAATLAVDVGVLLRAGRVFDDERYLDRARTWALHLAWHHRFHVEHYDAGMDYAKLVPGFVEAYTVLHDRFNEAEHAQYLRQLEAVGEAICRCREQWLSDPILTPMAYNNHLIFHHKGTLMLGLVLGRSEWVEGALDGTRGFGEMVVGATVDDGLCYESSTHYHFATHGALVAVAEVVRHCPALGRDLYRQTYADGRNLKQMFDAPLGLLLPNGELPPVGDCYANRQPLWAGHDGLYEIGFAVYGDPRYAWLLGQVGSRGSVPALLVGRDELEPAEAPLGRSRVWAEHGYALLTSRCGRGYWDGAGVVAFLAGDASGVHHHNDSLSLQVFAGGQLWTEDIESHAVEQHGFSARIQKAFNRTMLAHNTVVIDEQDQQKLDAALPVTMFRDLPNCRSVTMADDVGRVAPGVRMRRHVAVTPDYCLDVFEACGDGEYTCDWLVHPRADGPAEGGAAWHEAALPDREPYSVLSDVQATDVDAEGVALAWSQGDARCLVSVSAAQAATLYRGRWPELSDASTGHREMFMLRVRSCRARFVALYQAAGPDRRWRVTSREWVDNGEWIEVQVTVTDGDAVRSHIFRSADRRAPAG